LLNGGGQDNQGSGSGVVPEPKLAAAHQGAAPQYVDFSELNPAFDCVELRLEADSGCQEGEQADG
jgi:hypothetical protein